MNSDKNDTKNIKEDESLLYKSILEIYTNPKYGLSEEDKAKFTPPPPEMDEVPEE